MGRDATKPARQTWREWVPGAPEHELLTRAELLAAAERLGLFAGQRNPPSTLRHWADEGLIPGPVLEGAEGRERALYPRWVLDLIALLRRYQDDAKAMGPAARRSHRTTLAPRLRAAARQLARIDRESLPANLFADEEEQLSELIAQSPFWRRYREHYFPTFRRLYYTQGPIAPPFQPWPAPPGVAWEVRDLVTYLRERGDFNAIEATVRLVDADGLEAVFTVSLDEDGGSDDALSAAPPPCSG